MSRIVEVRATWTSVNRVEVPEGTDPDALARDINDARSVPEEVWDQITTSGAELTDWNARVLEVQ